MMDESKLIFIISQPRAGSTLLQKLISNNSKVDTVSEPWLLLPLLSIYKPELINAKYNYPVALNGFFDYLKKKDADAEFRKDFKKLILGLYKVSNHNQYFIDKTPRYYEMIPEMMNFFPSAKFLILKRNPFASLHSMLSTWSNGKIDYNAFKAFYRDFLVAPFLIQDFCKKNESHQNVKIVKYEDIVSVPESEVKYIYEWLGIEFQPGVLDLKKNEKVKGIYGDDVYKSQPLNEIQSTLKDSWKKNINSKELSIFFNSYQKFLSTEFIKAYGYSEEKFDTNYFNFGNNKFSEYISLLKKSGAI